MLFSSQPAQIMLFALLFILSSWTADAAEIRLRKEACVATNVVCLNDLIEQEGSELPAELAHVEVCLTPAAGEEKSLTTQQIHECLLLSGVAAGDVSLSGSRVVIVTRGTPTAAANAAFADRKVTTANKVALASASLPINKMVDVTTIEEQLIAYLRQQSGTEVNWQIEVQAAPRQQQWLSAAQGIRISGGLSPYLGKQNFLVQGTVDGNPSQIHLQTKISGTRTVLVMARTIPAGTLLTSRDVVARQLPHTTAPNNYVLDVQDALGLETSRSVAEGSPLSPDMLRPVFLVKKGEQVTLRSIAAGVTISVNVKALSDGLKGEVITVETLDTKEKLQARVTANKALEMYALGITRGVAE